MQVKQEFIAFLEALMLAAPDVVEKNITDDIRDYIELLKAEKQKPELTDNGKTILGYLQGATQNKMKSVDIANALTMNSRAVAGALRKLVLDGFCAKFGDKPAIYSLTEKGKNYKID